MNTAHDPDIKNDRQFDKPVRAVPDGISDWASERRMTKRLTGR